MLRLSQLSSGCSKVLNTTETIDRQDLVKSNVEETSNKAFINLTSTCLSSIWFQASIVHNGNRTSSILYYYCHSNLSYNVIFIESQIKEIKLYYKVWALFNESNGTMSDQWRKSAMTGRNLNLETQKGDDYGGEKYRQGTDRQRWSRIPFSNVDSNLLAKLTVGVDSADEVAGSVGIQSEICWAALLDGPNRICLRAVIIISLGYFSHIVCIIPVEHWITINIITSINLVQCSQNINLLKNH